MAQSYHLRLRELGIETDQLTLDHKGTLVAGPVALQTDRPLPRLEISDTPEADLLRGEQLGRGGMAVVTSATQRALRRPVAIKEPIDAGREGQLLREAMITGALEHPNIVPVHLLGRDTTGAPVLVMKRIDGTRWSERLSPLFGADGSTDEEALGRHLGILVQVCHAVAFAHSRGIVHRDLKPDNVMVGEFGEVYVVDWGIAHVMEDALGDLPAGDDEARLVGTPGYMAPEMAAVATISLQTDVYLLGAILHELLTGRRRHVGDNVVATLVAAYDSAPYDYPPWIPEELARLCNDATAADPQRRIASVSAFRDRVRDYLAHRSSREVAHRATQRVEGLEDLLGTDHRGQTFDAVEIHTLASEARFGLELALSQWDGNADARDELQRLLEMMVDYELGNGNVRAAAGLLADLPQRRPALEERLRDAVVRASRRREEIAELERLRQDGDLAVSAPERLRLSLWYGGILTTAILILTTLRLTGIHEAGYPDALGVMLVLGISLALSRGAWEGGNVVNRRIIDGIASSCALISVGFLLCWLSDIPFPTGLSVAMLVAATTAAALAVFVERGLVVTAIGFLLTSATVLVFPRQRGFVLAVGCMISFAGAAWVWRRMMSHDGPRPARSVRASGLGRVASDPRLSRHTRHSKGRAQ